MLGNVQQRTSAHKQHAQLQKRRVQGGGYQAEQGSRICGH